MDAQLLTVDTMIVKDFLSKQAAVKSEGEGKKVWYSRVIVLVVAAVAYVLALIQPGSILSVINWIAGGYASLMVIMIAALYWKRCTKEGALASLLVAQIIVLGSYVGIIPKSINFGMLPGLSAIIIGAIVLIAVSLFTAPQSQDQSTRFFSVFEDESQTSVVPDEKNITA